MEDWALLLGLSPDFVEPFSHLEGFCSLRAKIVLTEGTFFLTKSFMLLNGFVTLLKILKLLLEGFAFLSGSQNLLLKSFFLHCKCSFLSFESLNLFSDGFILLWKGLCCCSRCFVFSEESLCFSWRNLFSSQRTCSVFGQFILLKIGFVLCMKSSVLFL